MALTRSTMLALGTQAPSFTLLDTISNRQYKLQDLKSNIATVIMFICNHCPYVKHIQEALVEFANDYVPKGISIIAISANDAGQYPEDSPQNMKAVARLFDYPFPYLYDETQAVAKTYNAACTPDFFIFDRDLKCVYRGQFDDSRPGNNVPVTGNDIRAALNSILKGLPVAQDQKPSIGCNIKWRT